jgi:hypothetical protein
MPLLLPDGRPFATGSAPYDYRPVTSSETVERIVVQIEIEGVMTQAAIDTGGLYLVCTPTVARQLSLSITQSLFPKKVERILFRGEYIQGHLFRVNLNLLAEIGQGLSLEVTAFVPEESPTDWGELPCFLGLYGCLERLRFAIDPLNTYFYFGECQAD